MAFCKHDQATQQHQHRVQSHLLLSQAPAPTSTIRDSNCSTDSGSLFCTVALIICLFIMLYLCNARWCLCNTPFSCLSHRSFMGKGRTRYLVEAKRQRACKPSTLEHKHTATLYVISDAADFCFREGKKNIGSLRTQETELLGPRPVSSRGNLEHRFCQHFGSYQASYLLCPSQY